MVAERLAAWTFDRCTSMNGMPTAASASRSATLVCVNAAGLMMMYAVSSLFAAWIRSMSGASALLWKVVTSSPAFRPAPPGGG